jgi:zinc transport system permease protein
MIDLIIELFSYNFVWRAVIVGALISVCAALLGVTLVLKRYSMIGDGLSHVGFGSLSVAVALGLSPLPVTIPVVLAATFLLLRIKESSKIRGDAAVALISTTALAVGVLIISVSSGLNADVCNYLFGSIWTLTRTDLILSVAITAAVLVSYILCYNKLFAVTFDAGFARATGTKVGAYDTLIALLTALIITVGMRMMGAMLISGLIIFPALTAMRVFKRFSSVVICSVALSAACFVAGIILSFVLSAPTGASVVLINLAAFGVFFCIGKRRVKDKRL